MKRETLNVLSNRKIAEGHFVLELESARLAKTSKPGQFVQVLNDAGEVFLPRPFSFLDVTPKSVRILYQVVGKGTALIAAKKKGDTLMVLGPLGNGFTPRPGKTMLLVGGGVGIPPLYHLALHASGRGPGLRPRPRPTAEIAVFLGGRDKSLLHCESDFKKLGASVTVATDNGSKGHKGFVTHILEQYLIGPGPVTRSGTRSGDPVRDHVRGAGTRSGESVIYTCGPTGMLKAVSALAQKYGVECQVSVEEPMACGFGVCLGCAIKVNTDGHERFAISCTEGPVFDGKCVVWA